MQTTLQTKDMDEYLWRAWLKSKWAFGLNPTRTLTAKDPKQLGLKGSLEISGAVRMYVFMHGCMYV